MKLKAKIQNINEKYLEGYDVVSIIPIEKRKSYFWAIYLIFIVLILFTITTFHPILTLVLIIVLFIFVLIDINLYKYKITDFFQNIPITKIHNFEKGDIVNITWNVKRG